jgi:hypothetical protein
MRTGLGVQGGVQPSSKLRGRSGRRAARTGRNRGGATASARTAASATAATSTTAPAFTGISAATAAASAAQGVQLRLGLVQMRLLEGQERLRVGHDVGIVAAADLLLGAGNGLLVTSDLILCVGQVEG